jgi:hypothetical protein
LFPEPNGDIGKALPRYEGRAKVTASARCASDVSHLRTAYVYIYSAADGPADMVHPSPPTPDELRSTLSGLFDHIRLENTGTGSSTRRPSA